MLQLKGAKQRLLSKAWCKFWVLRLCSSPPQSWFWRITPHSLRTESGKWCDMMEPQSINERLGYDIVSFAVWFWPAHERGEGLLVKLCRRERGQKLFDVNFWSKNIGWMCHLSVQQKEGWRQIKMFNTNKPLSGWKMSANMKLQTDADICMVSWRKKEPK